MLTHSGVVVMGSGAILNTTKAYGYGSGGFTSEDIACKLGIVPIPLKDVTLRPCLVDMN